MTQLPNAPREKGDQRITKINQHSEHIKPNITAILISQFFDIFWGLPSSPSQLSGHEIIQFDPLLAAVHISPVATCFFRRCAKKRRPWKNPLFTKDLGVRRAGTVAEVIPDDLRLLKEFRIIQVVVRRLGLGNYPPNLSGGTVDEWLWFIYPILPLLLI